MTKHRTRFMKLCIFCKPICKQPNSFHAFKIWTKTNLSLLHKHSKHYVIMYTGPDFTPEAFTCFHTHHILSNNEKNTKQMAFYQRKIKCNCVLHLIHHLLNDLLWKKKLKFIYWEGEMQTAVTCYDAGMTDGLPHFQKWVQMCWINKEIMVIL